MSYIKKTLLIKKKKNPPFLFLPDYSALKSVNLSSVYSNTSTAGSVPPPQKNFMALHVFLVFASRNSRLNCPQRLLQKLLKKQPSDDPTSFTCLGVLHLLYFVTMQ